MSHGKPCLDNIIKEVKNQLINLEHGFQLNKELFAKFYLLSTVFDKPARASVLKMVNSNGYTSCLKCYQRGEMYQTKSI